MAEEKSTGKIILSGLFGAAAAAVISGAFNLRIERQQFEANSQLEQQKYYSSLIAKALDDDDEFKRARRLKFLLDLEIIHDKALAKKLADKASDEPTLLPRFSAELPPTEPTEWQVVIGDYKDENEQKSTKEAAAKAGYANGEPLGNPSYRHLRFRFASREEASQAAEKLKDAKVSHSPDVLRYKSKP
jgi:hypothetical protein